MIPEGKAMHKREEGEPSQLTWGEGKEKQGGREGQTMETTGALRQDKT